MKDLPKRENLFNIEVLTEGFEYDQKMLNEFYEYWSEPNKSGTKMKWELEKTWDLKRRLKRWFDNQNKWNGTKNNAGSTKLGTSAARTKALKNWSIGGKVSGGS